ncbi:MAG: sugar phosphate isomerase/epimerase family protein [Exiguobacterium sp.]
MLGALASQGVKHLELAPLRAFGICGEATEAEVRGKVERYANLGISITSFQALLFGSEGLALFESNEARQRMKAWLIAVGRVAGWCGAGPMVFGSPKNRWKGELSHAEAFEIAVLFFREVGDACAGFGSCLVMEANPEAYGADFCTRLDQAAELVDAVASPGFRLHVDAGGLALSGEDFVPVVKQSAHLIAHVHASQPHLGDWHEPHPVHQTLAAVLREIGYNRTVAIEMRMQDDVQGSVKTVIEKVKQIYFA